MYTSQTGMQEVEQDAWFTHLSSVTNISWSGLQCIQGLSWKLWAWGGHTCWMGYPSISVHNSHTRSHLAWNHHCQFSYSKCFSDGKAKTKEHTDNDTGSRSNQEPWSSKEPRLPAVPLCSLYIQNSFTSFIFFPCLASAVDFRSTREHKALNC